MKHRDHQAIEVSVSSSKKRVEVWAFKEQDDNSQEDKGAKGW